MIRLGVLALVFAGCGRFGFDGQFDGDARDDITDVDVPIDALPPTGPFGTPMIVTSLMTTAGEDDPSLTGDQLEIYFDSDRAGGMGGGDLWVATRAATTDPWGTARNIGELNTTGDDATPEVSRDGLTLYWVANGAAGIKDIYVATRASRSDLWGGKTRIVELASAADESGPTLTPDGLTIYFSRDPSGTDDIFTSTRASPAAAWAAPAAVAGVNVTGTRDGEPFINGANTLLLWSSARTGANDLYQARRASSADAWDPPSAIAELNTATSEGDPWLSPDEHVIYFSRNLDIYMATR